MDKQESKLISKRILSPGYSLPEFPDGSKVFFHFKTEKCVGNDDKHVILDDSHDFRRPMELILGKKFKLEVWEALIKTMRLNEISEFTVDKSLLSAYPFVSKAVRSEYGDPGKQSRKPVEHTGSSGHCCGMMAFNKEGLGHTDLDELVKTPQDLKFTLELLEVCKPGEYEKKGWEMNDEERILSLPTLKEEGNKFYREKRYSEAAQKYAEALGRLEQLVMKEKPGDEEWLKYEDMKIPYLLNYAQCKLIEGDFYPVIEHATTVLKRDPDNVKALYRRAQAHMAVWNPEEARQDYGRVKELDPSLANLVNKELKNLEDLIKQKNEEDKAKLMGKLF